MKGSAILNAVAQLLMVVLIVNVSQIKALSPEQTCPLVKNNTYIGDPSDCQGWVYCSNGKPLYGKCKDNLYFDSANGVCDYKANVDCNSNVQTMCEGLTDMYKADPTDCSKYCYCHEGATSCIKCPAGQFFDPLTTTCVWESTSSCVANSPCLLAPDGFVGVPGSCTKYMRCGSSQVVSQGECPQDRYYNPLNAMCDYPENVKCASNPSKPPGPNDQHIPPKGLCKKDETFYSDDDGCRGYYNCKTKGGEPKWGQCPKNTQFNESEQACMDPDEVICTKDRCDGTTKKFMAVANTKCMKYYNCDKGVATGQGSCPTDHPYFNELGGVCQSEPLDYKICA